MTEKQWITVGIRHISWLNARSQEAHAYCDSRLRTEVIRVAEEHTKRNEK